MFFFISFSCIFLFFCLDRATQAPPLSSVVQNVDVAATPNALSIFVRNKNEKEFKKVLRG